MSLERVDIINRALARIGEAAVQFDSEQDEEASELVWTYNSRIENTLAVYPWRSTLRTGQLVRGTIPALSSWTYAYLLQAGRIGPPRRVWQSLTLSDANLLKLYALGLDDEGRPSILTNAEIVVAEDQQSLPPSLWDAPLRELIIQDLAAVYALQVASNRDMAAGLREAAWGSTDNRVQGQFFLAKRAESTASPSRVATLEDGPLLAARRG